MKRVPDCEQLLTRVAKLHDSALACSDTELAVARSRFRRRVREGSWRGGSQGSGSESPIAARRGWALGVRWVTAVGAGAAALGVLLLFSRGTKQHAKVQVDPEPISSADRNPAAAATLLQPPPDPCAAHVRAAGKQPLLDDFEDQNPLIASVENRVGLWSLFKDSDTAGTFNTITPSPRPQATRANRYALHVVGGEMLNWGAVIQFNFQPACYDASAYSGVTFSAKGPGRIFVGMREISVVPPDYGGTCKSDCYNNHQKKVDLTKDWRSYVVAWTEMRQRGYGAKPLDASRVNGLSIVIQASDTPFDLWIDDVKFVTH